MMKYPLRSRAAAPAVALVSLFVFLLADPSIAETPRPASEDAKSSKNGGSETPSGVAAPGAGTNDAKGAEAPAASEEAKAEAPERKFVATAYALRGRTASGRPVAKGLIAADRKVLPLGSRVRLDAGAYSGEYTVADTGGLVRGRKIDIWMPSNHEARRFGRRLVKLTVLKYGGRRAPLKRP